MSDNNGWSDKPGVPLNSERDGWWWIVGEGGKSAMFWSAKLKGWCFHDGDNPACEMLPEEMRSFMVRVDGQCLTPAEVASQANDALKWRGAINDALTNWLSPIEDHETPKDALQRLIRLEVMAALDPAVSKSAADLVATAHKEWLEELNHDTDALMEQARQSALEEAAEEMDCACPQRSAVLEKLAKDGPLSHHWPCEKGDDCCALRGAAIRALKGEGNE